ncbi:hypothetical protein [Natronococcus amylolyticus]|nr:hypothetical protein [Natronococcus amylolyticus]
MREIQQIHWELEMDYIGHPYYVSGNAIRHALGQQLPYEIHRHLHASHGIFVPGQFGVFPDWHSRSGVRPHLGSNLPPVERYEDLFLLRRPSQPWLLDSRPRDALNTHDVRRQSDHPALAHEMIQGRPADADRQRETTKWYIHAYLHADREDLLPLDDQRLDGLQFGGKRNYGYGCTRLKETQLIDLDALDYTQLEESECHELELVTPFVLQSTYPGTNAVDVPWWWTADRDELRTRSEKLLENDSDYRCETIDHGQTVGYAGDRPVETAKAGITRVGTHSKFGFGEIRVLPTPDSLAPRIKKPNKN